MMVFINSLALMIVWLFVFSCSFFFCIIVTNLASPQLLSRSSSLASHKDKIIDGVVLTKYDTIDDKVGAAVSMVYSTGIPIMFVGVGQHYTDIKKLNVNSVVKALLK